MTFPVNTYVEKHQDSPAVAVDAEGNFTIVWLNQKSPSNIYLQRYSSQGERIGREILVNTATPASSGEPRLAMAPDGSSVVVWERYVGDWRWNIYAQRFDQTGARLGEELQVTPSGQSPNVAMDQAGNAIVAWASYQQGSWSVDVQRFDARGNRLGEPIAAFTSLRVKPSVAVGFLRDGDFLIATERVEVDPLTRSHPTVFTQRFDQAGNRLGEEVRIADGLNPRLAVDVSGNYVLAWQVGVELPSSIRAKRFDAQGNQLGETVTVVNHDDGTIIYDFRIAGDSQGNFTIEWMQSNEDIDSRNGSFVQRFDSQGRKVGAVFSLGRDAVGMNDLAYGLGGRLLFVGVSQEGETGTAGWFQFFDTQGNAEGSPREIIEYIWDTPTESSQGQPSLAVHPDGRSLIAWISGGQDGSGDGIYAQWFSSRGEKDGAEFRVNSRTDGNQTSPSVAIDPDGRSVVVWQFAHSVALQRFGSNRERVGNEVSIRDPRYAFDSPDVAMDGAGNFIVAWQAWRNDGQQDRSMDGVWAQWFDPAGGTLGGRIRVADESEVIQDSVNVTTSAAGESLVAWGNLSPNGSDVYARQFDRSGVWRSEKIKINADFQSLNHSPEVTADADGNFTVVWQSDGALAGGVFVRRFSSDGSPRGEVILVSTRGYEPTVASSRMNRFAVTWTERVTEQQGNQVFSKMYGADGASLMERFQISGEMAANWHGASSLGIDAQERAIIAWESGGPYGSRVFGRLLTTVCTDRCTNGAPDGGETDVDCGGICPTKCDLNEGCQVAADCRSNYCAADRCARASCSDGQMNGLEEGIDCGGDVCTVQCVEPVIIIPGILGSWWNRGVLEIDPLLHTYDELVKNLQVYGGYALNRTLFPFPYEWRNSNTITASLLRDKINSIKANNNPGVSKQKVDLVAHSMGGLVARYYIESNLFQRDVDQLIFLSTPHLGATKAYKLWEGGEVDIGDGKVNFFLSRSLTKMAKDEKYSDIYTYVRGKPVNSVMELLPVYDYLIDQASGVTRIYPQNYPRNPFLEYLKKPELVDYLTDESGVRLYNIYGFTGERTVDSLKVVPASPSQRPRWEHGEPKEEIMGSGDNTVPLCSLTFKALTDVAVVEKAVVPKDHRDVVTFSSPEVIEILTGLKPTITLSEPPRSYFVIEIHSPAKFYVVSPDGRKVGYDFTRNQEVREIPGSFYSPGDDFDWQFVLIPNPTDGDYFIYTVGTGSGNFELEVNYLDATTETVVTRTVTSTTEPGRADGFTVALSLKGPEPLSDIQGIKFLRGDSNGDGTIDLSDAINILGYLFTGGGRVTCLDAADANDSGDVDISDAIYTLSYLFTGGSQLPPPYPQDGNDATADMLGCADLRP